MSDTWVKIEGEEGGEAERLADYWTRQAQASGVFVRREGTKIYLSGPINLGEPPERRGAVK